MFDPVAYFTQLHDELLATKYDYAFCRVSSLNNLEEVLEGYKRNTKFFAIEDAEDGQTFRGAGAGYFERRFYTVYLLHRHKYGDMTARATILGETRAIFRDLLSRMIKDKLTIQGLSVENIRFYEVPPAFAAGTGGIYFTFTVENPVNLVYNANQWDT